MRITVIIPTYNPNINRIHQTIAALKDQTFPHHMWELIIVDNNSSTNFTTDIDISWHPNRYIIKEDKQGLTYARLAGFKIAKGDIIIMVDDDNILEENYLVNVYEIFNSYPFLGAAGGKSLPIYESPAPVWLFQFESSLAIRNLGEEKIINKWENHFPYSSPIGAGMALRTVALERYISRIEIRGNNIITDRNATTLSSGGDNDIVIDILKSGWQVGYFPNLELKHIIPTERMKVPYLARLNHDTNKSWIILLQSHGINPWKKIPPQSVLPRKIKAWFTYKAWKNKGNYIKWKGACGMYEALSI
ncbi:glycosyltransferase [Mucilaginibacter segetis]|uniref:Glycosyltransferase n=1 Tax=Mucilaginibacter segetis TaxID=2793071 RepID=A0A934PRC1_9SPHI|nr:glycosyltransferase [Mucilaginibacter segetis]MBK0378196.1 glycosyltransferase [Mucilaginibacter segetis]